MPYALGMVSRRRAALAGLVVVPALVLVLPLASCTGSPGSLHALALRKDSALIPLPTLKAGSTGSIAGTAQISFSHHDGFDSLGSHLLGEHLFPAENAE